MKFSDMPIGIWFTLMICPDRSFYRETQMCHIELFSHGPSFENTPSKPFLGYEVEDYEVMGEVAELSNRPGGIVPDQSECTRQSCPDIFKGHSVGCRYFK